MRLRNKRTGEIVSLEGELLFDNEVMLLKQYSSLAELNEEWEDVPEEPKTHWMIDTSVLEPVREIAGNPYEIDKEIGNWFSTKEEAELAVEKLKARKRLKDKGFRFNRWTIPERPKTPHIKLVIEAEMDVPDSPYDLDTCFGGEE